MFPLNLLALWLTLLALLPLFFGACDASGSRRCERPSNCGVLLNIKYPFRFEGDSRNCGHHNYQLSCEQNHTVLQLHSNRYYVQEINYARHTIRVTDPGVQKDNCSTLPQYSFNGNFHGPFVPVGNGSNSVLFVSCKSPVKSPYYVDTDSCLAPKDFSNSERFYTYVVVDNDLVASNVEDSCSIYRSIPSRIWFNPNSRRNISFRDIHNELAYGIQLQFHPPFNFFCGSRSFSCYLRFSTILVLLFIAARAIVGIPILFSFLIYKWQRRHLSVYDTIEEFLETRNNLVPIRYSYREIKKMTNNFKEKLGRGGYGDVYRGKLKSGRLVAIKMLNEAKGNGQDFVNEVATIGRIHHVNVVQLMGFCVTASKRALVYDYMPNGSLDKFIFTDDPSEITLGWEKAYEIAVGVARGIEYLHQGCDMQILHFDIKPHNILLDEDFVPKVSDFRLAKLYPAKNGVVTLTAVRGTIGYMAPELIYKKIGRISYKADVYSFGQLLLAMADRRRVDSHVDHSSQVYFASWIYDRVYTGNDLDLDLGDINDDERKIMRKIIVVGLWCVQWEPADRPSMREVLEMLEGDLEGLPMPPKPLFYPLHSFVEKQELSSSDFTDDSTTPLGESLIIEIEESD